MRLFPLFSFFELLYINELMAEDVVVAAEELRYASRAIGRVTGAVDVEDVLDSLFSTFCIGK